MGTDEKQGFHARRANKNFNRRELNKKLVHFWPVAGIIWQMPDAQDMDLLRQFSRDHSEAAFTELVRRHINLVYSVARRCTGNDVDAHDVTQAVFITLARKAANLREKTLLTGWLYETTRFTASRLLRANARRQAREQEAFMQSTLNENDTANAWMQLAPHLETAMGKLSEHDRALLMLRFYENKTGTEAAALLGIREDAAHKRAARAIEKLRKFFMKRGVTLSCAAIAGAVSANSVHAAPLGLATKLAATAYTAGATSFSLSAFIQQLLMKKTTYAVLSIMIATVTVPIILSHADGASDAPVTAASLKSGLVLHYTFASAPADGRVTDASGAGNDGFVTGAQWVTDPQRGGAFQFSPPGQYIRVPNNASLNPSNITLAAWIKTGNRGDTWRRVFDKSFTNGFALSIGGGHTGPGNSFQGKAEIEIGMRINNKKGIASSDRTVTDNEWHHLAMTYNGAEEILFVDGVQQKRVAHWKGIVPANSYDLTIGMNLVDPNAEFNEVGASFDGLIGEPMIFNRALSAQEIEFLFDSQRK